MGGAVRRSVQCGQLGRTCTAPEAGIERYAPEGGRRVFRCPSTDTVGRHETIEVEPGVYRHTEVNGDEFKAFTLTPLLPKTGFDGRVAKMAE